MADVLTILFQTALAGSALMILAGMVRESWQARTPHIGVRRAPARVRTRVSARATTRAATLRRLGY